MEEDEEYKAEDELHDPAATFNSLGCTPVKTKFAQKDRTKDERLKEHRRLLQTRFLVV